MSKTPLDLFEAALLLVFGRTVWPLETDSTSAEEVACDAAGRLNARGIEKKKEDVKKILVKN